MTRKVWQGLLAATGAVAVAAVSGGAVPVLASGYNPKNPPVVGNPKLHGTLNIELAASDADVWEWVARAYEKYEPGVKVRVNLQPEQTYQTWLTAQISGGHPTPDLVQNNVVAQLVAEGKFVNFQPYLLRPDPYIGGKPWADAVNLQAMGYNLVSGAPLYNWNLETVQILWMYNKNLWRKAGISQPPSNFDQFLQDLAKLKASGTIPWAIGGDYNSLWADESGWLFRIYPDQYTRPYVNVVRCRPKDYCYNPAIDAKWKYNPSDPYNDAIGTVDINPVRYWKAIQAGSPWEYNTSSPEWVAMYKNLQKLYSYAEPGILGTTDTEAYNLFLQQKTATILTGAWSLFNLPRDIRSGQLIGPNGKPYKASLKMFPYGIFEMPSMTGPYVVAPARTINIPIDFYGMVLKNPQQTAIDVNFMQWFTSPEGYNTYMKANLALKDGALVGPPIVNNVTPPPSFVRAFKGLKFIGNTEGVPGDPGDIIGRGLADYQPSVQAWVNLAQRFITGKMSPETFGKLSEENIHHFFDEALVKVGDMTLQDLKTPQKAPVPPTNQ